MHTFFQYSRAKKLFLWPACEKEKVIRDRPVLNVIIRWNVLVIVGSMSPLSPSESHSIGWSPTSDVDVLKTDVRHATVHVPVLIMIVNTMRWPRWPHMGFKSEKRSSCDCFGFQASFGLTWPDGYRFPRLGLLSICQASDLFKPCSSEESRELWKNNLERCFLEKLSSTFSQVFLPRLCPHLPWRGFRGQSCPMRPTYERVVPISLQIIAALGPLLSPRVPSEQRMENRR